MISLDRLKRNTGRLVELGFKDGHRVLARIIFVNADDPPEILYDVVKVVARGPERWSAVNPGVAASASPHELSEMIEQKDLE